MTANNENGNNRSAAISALKIASELGSSIAGDLGARAFTEMELAYASRLLPRFTDNPLIRIRQNILLYWDQSYFKTTLINEFAKTIPDGLNVVDITSMSPQMIFGSISEDRNFIIKPAFANEHFALVSELLSFIGSGNTMLDITNTMNKVMEGEVVTRQLLKLGQSGIDTAQIEELRKEGIYYDPSRAQLRHQPDVCILAASRPIDNRTYTYLQRSGHLYRYHILQHAISDREAKQYLVETYQPNLKLQSELKALNESLMKTKVKDLRAPPPAVLSEIFNPLTDIVTDEISVKKRRLAEILDIRTKGDVTRELTAHAFLRTASENGFQPIDSLEYKAEDTEFILRNLDHFVEFKLDPLFVEDWTLQVIRKQRPKDQVKALVVELLKDGNERSRHEIINHIFSKFKVSPATIDTALKELLESKQATSQRFGFYRTKLEGGEENGG